MNRKTKDQICLVALCSAVVFIVAAAVFSVHHHAVGFAVSLGVALVSLIIGLATDR